MNGDKFAILFPIKLNKMECSYYLGRIAETIADPDGFNDPKWAKEVMTSVYEKEIEDMSS